MIRFEHVGLRYGIGPEVLNDINFTLDPGSFHFLSGPSGAGKTSLMSLLYLGRMPTRGLIRMFGQNVGELGRNDLAGIRQKISVVFQDFRLLGHMSAFDNVALPLRIAGAGREEIARRVRAALDKVGLLAREKAHPIALSGGEQQRVAIARAVVNRPAILLADEPTANLDSATAADLLDIFAAFHQVGVTVVIATHDPQWMARLSPRVLRLERGRLCAA